MTLLRRINRSSALGTGTVRAPAGIPLRLRIAVIWNEPATRSLREPGAWLLFAAASVAGWVTAAIALGFL